MTNTWQIHDKYLTGKQQVHGRYTTDTWQVHDRYTAGTRQIHDRYLTGTWQVHDRHTTGTWQVHDRYTTGTWQVHDRYLTDTQIDWYTDNACAQIFPPVGVPHQLHNYSSYSLPQSCGDVESCQFLDIVTLYGVVCSQCLYMYIYSYLHQRFILWEVVRST